MSINIAKECPRYEKCTVNNCPLYFKYPNLISLKEEEKCTVAKSIRFRIGLKYPDLLMYQGLTVKEWTAKERYDKMTEEQKEAMAERGRKALSNMRVRLI